MRISEFPDATTILLRHVLHVLGVSSEEEVIWVDAGSYIAGVQYVLLADTPLEG